MYHEMVWYPTRNAEVEVADGITFIRKDEEVVSTETTEEGRVSVTKNVVRANTACFITCFCSSLFPIQT